MAWATRSASDRVSRRAPHQSRITLCVSPGSRARSYSSGVGKVDKFPAAGHDTCERRPVARQVGVERFEVDCALGGRLSTDSGCQRVALDPRRRGQAEEIGDGGQDIGLAGRRLHNRLMKGGPGNNERDVKRGLVDETGRASLRHARRAIRHGRRARRRAWSRAVPPREGAREARQAARRRTPLRCHTDWRLAVRARDTARAGRTGAPMQTRG